MPSEIIYGIECKTPELPSVLPKIGDNKFVRTSMPKFMNEVDRNKENIPIYNEQQLEFINKELDYCDKGYWFYNNHELTYITGFYYYYLNYWILENGLRPEYRDSDRRFFSFFQECYNDPRIIGILRGKKRREGASSQGTCIGTKIATFSPNKNYGNVSLNDDYAEKLYQSMILIGFFNLPEFLRPRLDSSGTNKKKLHFIETPKRGDNGSRKIEGLNSEINFMPTMLNSYDSTRLSFLLGDEWGKWEKVDITRYFAVVKECVKIGARKVGFIYAPTTLNPPDKGGNNFKKLWEGSNQFEDGKYSTSTGMVKYFQSAYDGLDGFIDEFGKSVIDEPDEETLNFLIKKQLEIPDVSERVPTESLILGARKYLEEEYDKLKSEEQKSDFKRKFPIVEDDMFDFGTSFSPFNTANITNRELELKNFPVPLRKGILTHKKRIYTNNMGDEDTDYWVDFEDNENGNWLIYSLPKEPNMFEVDKEKKILKATNTLNISIGVDTFRFDTTKELGSMGAICVGKKFDLSKSTGEEGGEIMALYVGRPKLVEFFNEEIMKACLFWGGNATVEHDAGQEYRTYFSNRMKNIMNLNCLPLLGRKPNEAIDPNRENSVKSITTTSSADPYVFSKQISLAQIYFEKYCHKIFFLPILEDAKRFNPDNRTKSDITISFMMCLLNMTGETKAKSIETKTSKDKFIPQYKVKGSFSY